VFEIIILHLEELSTIVELISVSYFDSLTEKIVSEASSIKLLVF